jgi:hypothetical protein
MLRYDWPWAGASWNLRADVYNVFDNGAVTWVDEIAEYRRNVPSEYYREPLAYQTPRRVRLGCGVSF